MPLQDLQTIKALTFDVFGTVVDWRSTVESALRSALTTKLTASSQLDIALQERIQKLLLTSQDNNHLKNPPQDWAATFAQEWRNAYKSFTHSFRAGLTPWKDIDTHHHDSLVEQLHRWGLDGLFTPSEIKHLSLVWHRLAPWPDSAAGIQRLGNMDLVTATLSNGNRSLLIDLNDGGDDDDEDEDAKQGKRERRRERLGFAQILSAEDFGAYKPDPNVYLGAAAKLGVTPSETAMVAAHLNDLEAARDAGLRTVYVERPGEEDWNPSEERYQRAKEGWVDLWVSLNQENRNQEQDREGGFVKVARLLGGVLGRNHG